MYYELVFESGSHSVASYDSEEEMLSAVGEQHRRATQGEDAGPTEDDERGRPAERVVKVLCYGDTHPADGFDSVSSDVAKSELDAALKSLASDGVVDVMQLSQAVRELGNPTVAPESRHDSMFKAKETKEFTADAWEKVA